MVRGFLLFVIVVQYFKLPQFGKVKKFATKIEISQTHLLRLT